MSKPYQHDTNEYNDTATPHPKRPTTRGKLPPWRATKRDEEMYLYEEHYGVDFKGTTVLRGTTIRRRHAKV